MHLLGFSPQSSVIWTLHWMSCGSAGRWLIWRSAHCSFEWADVFPFIEDNEQMQTLQTHIYSIMNELMVLYEWVNGWSSMISIGRCRYHNSSMNFLKVDKTYVTVTLKISKTYIITQGILFMQLHFKKYHLSFSILLEKWLLSDNENWW